MNEFERHGLSVVFISGHPRSGTNLMNRCLDGHSQIFAAPGVGKVNFLRRLAHLDWETMERGDAIDRIVQNVELKKGQDYMRALAAELNGALPDEPSYHAVVSETIAALARLEGVSLEGRKWFVEKNHNNEFYFDRAQTLFPSAKLIFIQREPLSIFASWKRMAEQDQLDISERQAYLNLQKHLVEEVEEEAARIGTLDQGTKAIASKHMISESELDALVRLYLGRGRDDSLFKVARVRWARLDRAAKSFPAAAALNMQHMRERAAELSRREPESALTVDYEALVEDTRGTMGSVANFLGIPFESILTEPTENLEDWGGNSSWNHSGGIYKGSLNKRDNVTPAERAAVKEVFAQAAGTAGEP